MYYSAFPVEKTGESLAKELLNTPLKFIVLYVSFGLSVGVIVKCMPCYHDFNSK